MNRAFAFLPFVFLTVVCWGNYGPLMHHGKVSMGDALRPFVGVGFAYFAIAVLVPLALLMTKGEKGAWSRGGTIWSLIAGAVGAFGALGVIVAFNFNASPVYVMPLVFGGAPVVNTIVTMGMSGTFKEINKIFLIGVLLAAVGAAGVLYFKPGPPATSPTAVAVAAVDVSGASATTTNIAAPAPVKNYPAIYAAVIVAVLSWGAYGPVLHKGQMLMSGSRLRPFLCVGLAYFFIAVAIPLVILAMVKTAGEWNQTGILWSLAGGAAGAIGALGIIYAFNFGGKPVFVMPLVFGFAPVMNTITSLTETQAWSRVGGMFWLSLLVVIAGAVLVLVFAPKPGHKPVGPAVTVN